MAKIVHNIHFPVSARSFIVPIVEKLNDNNLNTELWLENPVEHSHVFNLIKVELELSERLVTTIGFGGLISNFTPGIAFGLFCMVKKAKAPKSTITIGIITFQVLLFFSFV